MAKIDKKWFQDIIKDKSLAQHEVAARIGVDKSTLSLIFNGKRQMQMQHAVDLARELGQKLDDVVEHAGIHVDVDPDSRIPIIGFVDGRGNVFEERGLGSTASPGVLPADAAAFILRTAESPLEMLHGWTAFVGRHQIGSPETVIDRTAIVDCGSARMLRLVRRGSAEGVYTLTTVGFPPIYDVAIQAFRRVLLFRPI